MNSSCHGAEGSDAAIALKFQLDGHAGKPARNDKQEEFITSRMKTGVFIARSAATKQSGSIATAPTRMGARTDHRGRRPDL
ncbi:MAG: hypothetical protein ABIV50_13570 [Opitutus sp.]